MKILPSLLYPDLDDLAARFKECAEVANEVHIDFADGKFVPNTLPDVVDVANLDGDMVIEAHLMVADPQLWVKAALNDPRFERILIHAEVEGDLESLLQEIRGFGRRAGLAIKPETSVEAIAHLVPQADEVLVLLVDPGFNGSPFQPEALAKITELKRQFPQLTVAVDGGINPQTLPQVVAAGADRVAVGSYLHDKQVADGLLELERVLPSVGGSV